MTTIVRKSSPCPPPLDAPLPDGKILLSPKLPAQEARFVSAADAVRPLRDVDEARKTFEAETAARAAQLASERVEALEIQSRLEALRKTKADIATLINTARAILAGNETRLAQLDADMGSHFIAGGGTSGAAVEYLSRELINKRIAIWIVKWQRELDAVVEELTAFEREHGIAA